MADVGFDPGSRAQAACAYPGQDTPPVPFTGDPLLISMLGEP